MNLDNAFGVHAQALLLRSKRSELLAANIANTDTPNFKARDFDFHAVLNQMHQQGQAGMASSSSRLDHLQYRIPNSPSLDGNTVDSDLERSEFMENSLAYRTSLQFLNGRIRGLITAIRGE